MSVTLAPAAIGTVALAGNPNSGKTTLFNALTGLRQKVANYPGITVEKKTGRCRLDGGRACDVIDLPGTYSLVAGSPDEQVAMEVLRGLRADTPAPDAVVAVVDASNLPRNLYLVSQLMELGRPLIIALNMMDIAERRGLGIDLAALAARLGVAVVPVVGHKRQGIDALKRAIACARAPSPLPWPLPEAMWEEIHRIAGLPALIAGGRPVETARRLLVDDTQGLGPIAGDPAVVAELAVSRQRFTELAIDPVQADVEARYRWIDEAVKEAVTAPRERRRTWTQRVDAVLVHRWWGLVIFALVMSGLFVSIFWLAKPIMDAVQGGVDLLGALATRHLADGPLKSLLADGVFKGVGAVVVFVPQIAMLFAFLAVLEDSGYLARAAFIMDRLLARVGLHGKSFIPLLSSFACAIPGIMAARTIDGRRERLATILVAPFMSCSARLPVYTLLIEAFFGGCSATIKGLIMLGCYALGIAAAAGTAWALRLFTAKRERVPSFILELPSYKVPQASQVALQVWANSSKFLTKAGTTIFCLSVLLWALAYYPRLPEARAQAVRTEAVAAAPAETDAAERASVADQAAAQAQLAHSCVGRFGHAIEPALSPLGFDWKIGVGLVGAFAAREVFNSYLGIIYSIGASAHDAPGAPAKTERLQTALRADRRADGHPVWTPLVATSLLAWFVLAMQCMSTFAVVRRETGGWRWPVAQLVYMNALAYVVSLAIYQFGIRLGW